MQLNSLFSFLGRNPLSADGDAQVHADASQATSGFGAMFASTLAMLSHRPGASGADAAAGRGGNLADAARDAEHVEAGTARAEDSTAEALSAAEGGSEKPGKPSSDEAASTAQNERGGTAAKSAADSGEASLHAAVAGAGSEINPRDNGAAGGGEHDAADSAAREASGKAASEGDSDRAAADRRTAGRSSAAPRSDADVAPSITAGSDDGDHDVDASSALKDAATGRRYGKTGDSSGVQHAPGSGSRTEPSGAGDYSRSGQSPGADASSDSAVGDGSFSSGVRSAVADGSKNVQAGAAEPAREVRSAGADNSKGVGSGAADNSNGSGATDSSSKLRSAAAGETRHPDALAQSAEARTGSSAEAARIGSGLSRPMADSPADQAAKEVAYQSARAAAERRFSSHSAHAESAEFVGTKPPSAKPPGHRGTEGGSAASQTAPANGSTSLPEYNSTVASENDAQGSSTLITRNSEDVQSPAETASGAGQSGSDRAAKGSDTTPTSTASNGGERRRASELERSVRRLAAERAGVRTETFTKSASGETESSSAPANTDPQTPASSADALVDGEPQPTAPASAAPTPAGDGGVDTLPASQLDTARDDSATKDRSTHDSDSQSAAGERHPSASEGGEQSDDFKSEFDGAAEDAFDMAADELAPDIIEFEDILDARETAIEPDAPADAPRSESSPEPVLTSERTWAANASAGTAASERAARPRHGGAAQWMHTLLENGLDGLSFDEEWKVLEMKLDEGQGTMTVRARRDEEKVSITVNFSDPQLRALAAEQADRLQETLRAQYQTDVDFSLMSDNAGQSHADDRRSQGGGSSDANAGAAGRTEPLSGAERARATRAALAGARNEWIG